MAVIREWAGDGLSPGNLTTSTAGTGDDAFDLVAVNGGTPTIVASGTRSPRIRVSQSSTSVSFFQWDFTEQTVGAGRFYYTTASAWPGSSFTIALLLDGTSEVARIDLGGSGSAGQLRVRTGTTQVAASSTGLLSTSTTYRFEWTLTHSGASGVFHVKVFAGDSTTLTGQLSPTANFGVGHDNVRFGASLSGVNVGEHFIDDLAIGDAASFIGPVASANDPPTVNAGVDQSGITAGATVTLTATANDPDGPAPTVTWAQTGGSPTVTLSGTGLGRTFTAPTVAGGTILTFTATADDGTDTAQDSMTVAVLDPDPPSGTDYLRQWSGNGLSAGTLNVGGGGTAGTGDDPFDEKTGSPTVVTTGLTRSPHVSFPAAGTTAHVQWNFTPLSEFAVRWYEQRDAIAPGTIGILQAWTATRTAQSFRVELLTSGVLRLRDTTNAILLDSTGTVVATNLTRYEVVGVSGSITVTAYNGDTNTVLATLSSGGAAFETDGVRFGGAYSVPSQPGWKSDDFAVSDVAVQIGSAAPSSNTPPTANAGPDQSDVEPFATVTLTSAASTDPDGTVASRVWSQTDGTTVALSSTTATSPTFTAPAAVVGQTLTFSVVVTDNAGAASVADTVNITVLPHDLFARRSGAWTPMRRAGIRRAGAWVS